MALEWAVALRGIIGAQRWRGEAQRKAREQHEAQRARARREEAKAAKGRVAARLKHNAMHGRHVKSEHERGAWRMSVASGE